ncbi:MAG: hypothetical protein M1829_002847 [Trizodia sp. TS-e1964]|nr:MAG: hypothetical protein M1829_002847 [Trizodia sp. TS-e1964]
MPATASGAQPTPDNNAKSRDHKQGNQERKYTIEQRQAVIRVKKCKATEYYDILGLEDVRATVTDMDIKKAYRKLSLLTHPDKNGYQGADDAFKMVARAFQVLSDADKKAKYDRFGGDPDSRFGGGGGGGGAPSSPFAGFGGRTPGGGSRAGPMWDDEISPEEMFNRFFSGAMGGGGGAFGGGGPQMFFNLGGGPGFRVHQFGGPRPRARPGTATGAEDSPPTLRSTISNLLPLLILFVLPLLSSFFTSSASTPAGPTFRFDHTPPFTLARTSTRLKVAYWVDPREVEEWGSKKWSQLDQRAEVSYVGRLRAECEAEMQQQQRKMAEAQGWFFQNADLMNEARAMTLRSCRKLDDMRIGRSPY